MLKIIAKAAAAGVLYHSGVLDRLARPPLTVLGYHRVIEGSLEEVTASPLGMVTTAEMFERQIGYATRRYRMVSLVEIQEACEAARPLPPRPCLVTFDDGWEDNYTIAYPILRRMGVPAAVFLTTDYIGTRERFWFTSLMQCLLRKGNRGIRLGDGREAGCPADVAHELDRLASLPQPLRPWQVDRLVEMIKRYAEPVIDTMVGALTARLDGVRPEAPEESYFLTWDQVREMERGGIDFGSHTCTHRILTQLSAPEATEELRRSRAKLEMELGRPVVSIAFPNGDYTQSHLAMAWELGYRLFFVSSRAHPGGPEVRVFPRPCVHDRVGRGLTGVFSPSLLEFHLAGVRDRVPRWVAR